MQFRFRAVTKSGESDWSQPTLDAAWAAWLPQWEAKTSVTGLTPGSSVQFRYRAVTPKGGAGDWSLPITMPLVK